jgi:hypothetical protein
MCSTDIVATVPWPLECRLHHPWRPDTVTVAWEPCDCPPARAARNGHLTVRCNYPRCQEEWMMPLHRPELTLGKHKDNPSRYR